MTHYLSDLQNSKAKIFLIAGFLGSGKTTLLKRILSWDTDLSDTVVLVNEFGKVGIDGALLKNAGTDIFELTSGCICCTIRTELADTLKRIYARFSPKRILLEATGVAQPNAVVKVLEDDELKKQFEIEKIVTVLDIRYWINRENFGQFYMKQVQQANLILLNKVDTAEKNVVTESLSQLHEAIPGCHVVPTIFCKIDSETIWTDKHKKHAGEGILDVYHSNHYSEAEHEDEHHGEDREDHEEQTEGQGGFVAFDFSTNTPLAEPALKRFLDSVPRQLFRIKGPVQFPDHTALLNFVAGEINWDKWEGVHETRLAFVGWDLKAEEIILELKKCLIREEKTGQNQ
ncbi:MAG: GTP-binding protein [Deltaproteobacteria bacterium]|nr:MAG: GTP-binding protein [Deltaproteobacteria bacterium]